MSVDSIARGLVVSFVCIVGPAFAGGEGVAEIAWTKTICSERDRYIGWPTVCRLRNGDLGYPASTLLEDGWILTVFYQQPRPGEKTCLMVAKWRLK